ncbi:MAG: STAS domain-containing protein [Spirochaetota bacterium]
MELEISKKQEITILTPDGNIDLYNVSKLRFALDKLHTEKVENFIIDLQKVEFIDSSGLSVFIREMTRQREHGRKLKLASIGESVERLFRWTTTSMHIDKFTNLDEAIRSYQP